MDAGQRHRLRQRLRAEAEEKDPSASVLLAELWAEAGLPDGVLTVLQGDQVAVEALLDDPAVAAVNFVGSTPVARAVHTRATANAKRVQALGGAKNHMVVLPDAGVDLAADAAVSAAYGSAGERCMAVSVVVAVGAVADPLVEAVADAPDQAAHRGGDRPRRRDGPAITAEHRDRVAGYLEGAEAEGARLVVDGRRHELAGPGGFFLGASLVDRVRPGMAVYDDEIFGPVLRWCGPTPTRRPWPWSTPTPTATGPPSSPATAGRPVSSSGR